MNNSIEDNYKRAFHAANGSRCYFHPCDNGRFYIIDEDTNPEDYIQFLNSRKTVSTWSSKYRIADLPKLTNNLWERAMLESPGDFLFLDLARELMPLRLSDVLEKLRGSLR